MCMGFHKNKPSCLKELRYHWKMVYFFSVFSISCTVKTSVYVFIKNTKDLNMRITFIYID